MFPCSFSIQFGFHANNVDVAARVQSEMPQLVAAYDS